MNVSISLESSPFFGFYIICHHYYFKYSQDVYMWISSHLVSRLFLHLSDVVSCVCASFTAILLLLFSILTLHLLWRDIFIAFILIFLWANWTDMMVILTFWYLFCHTKFFFFFSFSHMFLLLFVILSYYLRIFFLFFMILL